MTTSCLWFVPVTTFIWTSLYSFICKTNPKRSHEWNCRVIAMLHALLVTKLVEVLLIIGPWQFDTFGDRNTLLQNVIMVISAGYFIFEIIWCIVMRTEGVIMLMHHVISLISLIGGLINQNCGSEVTAVIWGSELTNPFLQTRWFLREIKEYASTFAKINDFIFFTLFAVVRIGIGTYMCVLVLSSGKTVLWIKIGGCLFQSIGYIWMWQIVSFARRRFVTKGKTTKS